MIKLIAMLIAYKFAFRATVHRAKEEGRTLDYGETFTHSYEWMYETLTRPVLRKEK